MAINDNKISNVIGTHIPFWLLEQLKTRSKKGTQTNRDNENLKYLANKTGWVRLVSSINITAASDTKYFQDLTGITLSKPEDLAKNFVLYGGVSKYGNQNGVATYTLRKGFKETYSMLGDQEVRDFGYRPMPGLTRVVVETQGRLGSIRGATIEFKVWDKSQLDIIDALYFKLGYMMFLEWGNTFYYESESSDLKATELLSLDPFKDNLTKEQIALQLGAKRRESKGNYDGMLGMVSNFSFSYNQEGGYDCVLKLVGLGSLADSLKINQPATLAQPLKFTIEQLNNIYRDIQKEQEAKENAEKAIAAAKEKQAEEAKRVAQIEKEFNSWQAILLEDNKKNENLESTPLTVTNAFFNNYAVSPSDLITSSNKKDYNYRLDYDYWYYPDSSLYLKKYGVILTNETKINRFAYNSSNITKALNQNSPQEAAQKAYIPFNEEFVIDKPYEIMTQYFSNSNNVATKDYSGPTPYNFILNVKFPEKNKNTGNTIVYSHTKVDMIADIISFFTENKFFERMARTGLRLNKENASVFLDKNNKTNPQFLTRRVNAASDLDSINIQPNYQLTIIYEYRLPGTVYRETKEIDEKGRTTTVELRDDKSYIPIEVSITISDSSIISGIELSKIQTSTQEYQKYRLNLESQNTAPSAAQNTNPTSNTSTDQTKPAVQYQSSLEATLRSIQIHSLIEAINASSKKIDLERKVKEIDLATENFAVPVFSDGIFKNYIGKIINNSLSDSNPFEKNIKYGFNSALLSNKITGDIPKQVEVDYKKLLKSYVLPYDVNQDINDGSRLAHPVYIQLGLLMFILNHCCNLYDEKTDKTKTPLLYIDYNPETNFCLSHPCHMTTNGMTFMIPFQGTFDDYKTLFYSNILDGDNIKGNKENNNALTPLFSPEKDTISGDIPRFKGEEKIDAYRGKIMNVLINIDYVFDIIKQFFSQDQTNSVFLKAFVEQILSDMNKTLGNFNIFRFSYDDTSNCLQIIDDQLVPGLPEEVIVPKTSDYDIPIYGRDSIARSLDLRTDISSKMANVLAISANAEVQKQSANSVDGTPYGFINQSYKDRYISNRTENSNIIKKEDGKKTTTEATDAIVSSALKFNKNVTDFYGTYNPSTENIGHATNYYIEKFSVSKLAPPTRAAAMIPVSINFTLDGISGFNMMQGFTISEKFLPYTYNLRNSSKGSQKVGFMVTGNVHTIENNEWTTAIKANMTYLKERGDFSGSLNTSLRKGKQASFNPQGAGSSNTTSFVATNTQAQAAVETYLGRQISSKEFSELISAIFAEASNSGGGSENQEERAHVAAVILNRTRDKYLGATTISETLTKPSQFEAVTGNASNGNSPIPIFLSGPDPTTAGQIYSALITYLPKVKQPYKFFTAANPSDYKVKAGLKFRDALLKVPGSRKIGGTIFSTSAS